MAFPDATAVVPASVVHGRRPGEWTRHLGLEFDELDLETKRLLARLLGTTPPVPPPKGPPRTPRDLLRTEASAELSAPTASAS